VNTFISRSRKRLAIGSVAMTLLFLVVSSIAYLLIADRPPSYVNDQGSRFSLFFVMLIVAQTAFLAATLHKPTYNIFYRFFTAKGTPLNLSVFRIILFTAFFLYVVRELKFERIIFLSQLPVDLRYPPLGLGFIIYNLPVNATLAAITTTAMLVFCVMAAIGLFTRTSAILTVVFALYALGIPQIYGKVNHYHHLVWFAAILAMSRCSDVLSVDAIFSAWRRADRGETAPPTVSVVYALPLRFVWLTLGVIYFFPGVWKYWSGGPAWIFSDNLKFVMYQKWFELGTWQPLIRIDQSPLVMQMSALGTILFEVSFIFLLFSPRLRSLAAIGGIVFHTVIYFTMRIWFWTLQLTYASFVNWSALCERLGQWFYHQDMFFIYDGNCQMCRRTIASIRTFDLLNRVTYVNALDTPALEAHGLNNVQSDALLRDIHAVVGERVQSGFAAYRALAARIPLLWPVLPLLYLPFVSSLATRMYRQIADSRTCSIATSSIAPAGQPAATQFAQLRPLIVVATGMLAINFLLGAGGVAYAWPFASYPTFEKLVGPTITVIRVEAHDANGAIVPFDERALKRRFSGERWSGMIRWTIRTKNEKNHERRLRALAQVILENEPQLRGMQSLDFYELTFSTLPERRNEGPINKNLLLSLPL